jgi:hypothetical protein
MLTSLSEAFKYLFESLMIVILFSLFFAVCGFHLFYQIFTYRCFQSEYGIADEVGMGCFLIFRNGSNVATKSALKITIAPVHCPFPTYQQTLIQFTTRMRKL